MTKAHRQARRFLWRMLLVLVVLGTAGNVLVAWSCAVFIEIESMKPALAVRTSDRETWRVFLWSRAGAQRACSQRFQPGSRDATSKTKPPDLLPNWSGFDRPTTQWQTRTAQFESRMADARGWPLLSMCSRTEKAFSAHKSVHDGVAVLDRVLPLRPLWPGFLADSALYAFAAALPIAPLTIRRFCRLWRYRCVKCGYPIGTSRRCTECGHLLDHQVYH